MTQGEPFIVSVSQLTRDIKAFLERSFSGFWVRGEVSDFRPSGAAGHVYFDLKDAGGLVHEIGRAHV